MKQLFRNLTVIAVLMMTLTSNLCHGQQGDAFFLVDVSGSMRNQATNQEAKQIGLELLQGGFSLSNWQARGWRSVSLAGSYFSNPSRPMMRTGGKFCLMPFGNMLTVKNYKMTSFDSSTFSSFYNEAFPKSHSEQNTYLTLAKAYSVVLAANAGLEGKMLWLIVYSDGMGDSMPSNSFPADLQEAWDQFGATQASFTSKKGTLRKTVSGRNYDIEVWTMGPIPSTPPPSTSDSTKTRVSPSVQPKFKISSPQNGVSENTAVELKKDESATLTWVNNSGSVTMSVQMLESGKPVKMDRPNDHFTKTVGSSSAKIIFHKGGMYRVVVKDAKMNSDSRYYRVKSSFPVLPVLLFVLAVIAGIFAYNRYIDGKKRKVFDEQKESGRRESTPSRDSDWE